MLTENTHFGPRHISEWMKVAKSVFFIGIGGINMSSLAHLTHIAGYRTGGSDRTESELTRRLENEGIEIKYRHDAENIAGYDVIVYTVAIPPENPEYAAAAAAGLPLISRADYLGYLMTGYKNRIGISGMHGKSTCTTMCAQVFMEGGADPTVMSGAEMASMNGAYRIGGSENFIFEACEYMDSFLDFNPNIAVVLNIEPEHLDYFSGIEQIKDSFVKFARIAAPQGSLVANADDENVREVVSRAEINTITFGIHNPEAIFRAANIVRENGFCSFDIMKHDAFFCRAALSVPGVHNVYNALASAAVADLCGIEADRIAAGLRVFTGAKRRLERVGTMKGAIVFSDYAHHPTEIRASLESLANMGTEGELICVFQPHTYSRTAALFDDFAAAFGYADRVLVTDIYAARGAEDYGVSSKKLAAAIEDKAEYMDSMEKTAAFLVNHLLPGDKVVIMGAGDIDKLIPMLDLDPDEGNLPT
ncbi:MAG: UDP-N-acetylmuramate--L-alanine ligase [Eubacteriales bacterium]|jgi:UDP-N-acetylmuramate--alanine ligase